jgi:RHS repeat-associated protein
LSDGTNTYLYGNGRISQHTTQTEYFLGDALGSVRQLADTAGAVTLTQSYAPYGETISSIGNGATAYQFTGEMRDSYIKLIYLRSRYYAPGTGRFLTKDSWQGDYNRPLSLNQWNYVEGNPVNFTDPSGHIPECGPFQKADLTQWFIDELNADKNTWMISTIKTYMDMSEINNELPMLEQSFDPALWGYALFADAVKSGGLWDFKLKINDYIGGNIRIADNWYFYAVPGNIAFV